MTPSGGEIYRCVAVLPVGDPRGRWWDELFGGRRVPVRSDEPQMTVLPDETVRLCYFVDFTACDWLKPKMQEALAKRPAGKNSMAIDSMLRQDIYPVIADSITVIRAPIRLFRK